jgi:HK97 family phage major capsid protein
MEVNKTPSVSHPPEYRSALLGWAESILHKQNFTHEDKARCDSILALAAQIGPSGELRIDTAEEEKRHAVLCSVLSSHRGPIFGRRDLNLLTNTLSLATSVLVAQQFYSELMIALRAFDALFDPRVVRFWDSDTGAPAPLPSLDVTSSTATQVSEGATDPTDANTVIQAIALASAPLYRTPLLVVSVELLQDSKFDIANALTFVQGIQFGLGIGPDLVTALLSGATLGCTAVGCKGNTGGSNQTGANSIGWFDLITLRTSVDAAYRTGPKVGWGMNDNTLAFLDSLSDEVGHPIFPQVYNQDGRRMLMGYPVFLMPSMPNIGANNTPVVFGNFDYFVVRVSRDALVLRILQERYAEVGKVAYFSKIRANGALLAAHANPIKYLQNSAS